MRRQAQVLRGDRGEGFALRHGRVARPRLIQLHLHLVVAAAVLQHYLWHKRSLYKQRTSHWMSLAAEIYSINLACIRGGIDCTRNVHMASVMNHLQCQSCIANESQVPFKGTGHLESFSRHALVPGWAGD